MLNLVMHGRNFLRIFILEMIVCELRKSSICIIHTYNPLSSVIRYCSLWSIIIDEDR